MSHRLKIIASIFTLLLLIHTYPVSAQIQDMPQARLTAPSVVQAEAGREFFIALSITVGNQEASISTVRSVADSPDISVESRELDQTLPPNATLNAILKGVAQKEGLYRVTLEVDVSGNIFTTEVMVDVDKPKPDSPPVLKVSDFTVEPVKEGQFLLNLTIANVGESKAQSIRLSLDAGTAAFPVSGGNMRTIDDLSAGQSTSINYILSSKGALSGHPVNIAFEFQDAESIQRKLNDTIFISFDREPALKITGFRTSAGQTKGEFHLSLDIKNTGLSKAKNIEVRFTGNQTSPVGKSAILPVDDIAAGAAGRLSLAMQTKLENEAYIIPFEITYRSHGGAEQKIADTVVVTAESIGIDPDEKPGLLSVIIDRFTISEETVFAGREFTLTIFIKNTSDEPTGKAKITLGEARTGNVSGSVFSPLDGRSVFYAESIPANGEISKRIKLSADRNASAMTYSLPITIEYEEDDGRVSTVNSNIGIPVIHEGRLRILTFDVPSYASVGEAVPVSLEFANTGKVDLSNMFISLEGDFGKENATFFIPSFELGTSDFFHATIFPEAEGTLKGNIVITYDDSNGKEVRIERPFTMKVQSEIDETAALAAESGRRFGGMRLPIAFPLWIYAAIILLAAVIVIAMFITVKKIKAGGVK